jgi:RimJ/RimL family protein N-acetyltransferase
VEPRVSIEIVPLRGAHIEGYHAALDAVARERRYLAFLEAPSLDATRAFTGLALTGQLIQHVALDGDRVVGWCDVIVSDRETMRHGGMLGVGIVAEHRGRGLGARLIGSVLTAAREAGLVRIALQVRAENARAIALYERLGFRHEGRLRRNLRIDGVDYDSLLMAILMDEASAS